VPFAPTVEDRRARRRGARRRRPPLPPGADARRRPRRTWDPPSARCAQVSSAALLHRGNTIPISQPGPAGQDAPHTAPIWQICALAHRPRHLQPGAPSRRSARLEVCGWPWAW